MNIKLTLTLTFSLGIAGFTSALVMLSAGVSDASAQSYPNRPIRLIVAYPPGGGADIVARILGQKLSDSVGQQIVVDNRSGAAGIIGTDIAAKSIPDGYTLIMGTNATHGIFVSLYRKLPYDPVKDFAPVSNVVSVTNVVVLHPSVPARSVKELIALAKSKPGQLNYGSGGSGSNAHLAVELFKIMAGVDIVHLPYKGVAPAVTDLLGGQIQMMISNMPPVLPHVKAGKLRALAVTGAERSSATPDLPTVAEAGLPGYESDLWWGVLAPAGTPRSIVSRLNAEIVKILQLKELKDRLSDMGATPVGNSPEEFAATIKADILKWAKVVKQSGAHVD
jgi:tripartite-type tricarboxylate transporter receptor subunit TctC